MFRRRHTTCRAIYSSFFILHFSFLLLACAGENKDDTFTLLFTGDVLLDRGVRPLVKTKGVEHLFEGIADDFARADAVIINLECPLADTLSPVGKQYIFHADTRWAAGLRDAGVTHACMANNHTNDQSRRGLRSTAQTLEAAGIAPVGYGATFAQQAQPTLIRKGDTTVALFNSVTFPLENWAPSDSLPDVCQLSAEALATHIRSYKAQYPNHVVIAVLHWGTEFQQTPSMRQRLGAAALASAGCDAVIGHHPHVVQPAEWISADSVPVFYSLGNFVFDQTPPQTRQALVAEVTLRPAEEGSGRSVSLHARSIPVTLRHCRPHHARR
ncbi:MAG: CapA family protein [Bacteroidaceae bacterium]|nr:CapA family protein [Bacteroidaceae bacterium]